VGSVVDLDEEPLVIRVWWAVTILATNWLLIFAILAWFAGVSIDSTSRAAISSAVLAVVGIVVAVRSLRSCLRVDESGMTIRNPWRTRSWAWHEIGEVGWDSPAMCRGTARALSVGALGDPHTVMAVGTAAGLARFRRFAALLGLDLEEHGVDNRILDEIASTHRWWADPRSRRETRTP
jgi:hypothetical protein